MKTIIHKATDRGFANHGWLQAAHSFSFANYHDPNKLNFGALRVLNDDIIAPKMGFGTHPHNNMEIITIPLSGVLKHRDNVHNDWQSILPGEVQIMSAGSGVEHSEINGSVDAHLSLFQLWIVPNMQNVTPRYDQKKFTANDRKNKLQVVVSSFDDNFKESLKIYQDARISRIDLDENTPFKYELKSNVYGVYMMIIHGDISIDNQQIGARDAIGITETNEFSITSETDSSLLFIEVPL